MNKLNQYKLIVYTSILFTLFYNISFFYNVLSTYELNLMNGLFILSLAVLITTLLILLLSIFTSKYTLKPALIILVFISALSSYFMNTYHVFIDESMVQNVLQTNLNESLDLFSMTLVLYIIVLAIIPSLFIWKIEIEFQSMKRELFKRLKTIVLSLLLLVVILFSFSQYYASFFREHKSLRYYVNPTYILYSIGKYVSLTLTSGPIVVEKITNKATIDRKTNKPHKLIIMVVGEAARADHFSLNGYTKETNPLLKKEDIINLSNIYSCGTSTAISVPCMFSIFTRDSYSYKKGITHENVLDVLNSTQKVDILWRDNNSDSKGVALRVPYENYKKSKNNTICTDGECRDEGMLIGLDEYIEKRKDKDILIVLHQMGNHGPEYYKRYPKSFGKYKPECKTNQLEECTKEEINNAYDNAILYTDTFLSKTIDFLKKYDNIYNTGMIYMSDHGESLGENRVYLHGLPYIMAPEAQIHVGSLMWFSNNMKKEINIDSLRKRKDNKYSQDNLFHTLLGVFDVKTDVYDKKLDILQDD